MGLSRNDELHGALYCNWGGGGAHVALAIDMVVPLYTS